MGTKLWVTGSPCILGHLQEDALQLPDGDVVDGAGAELAAELLRCEAAEVVDVVGPQVEHVVAREPVTLLHHHDPVEVKFDGFMNKIWNVKERALFPK